MALKILGLHVFHEPLLSKIMIKNIYIGKAYSHMHLHIHDEEDIISVTLMCACLYHTYLSWQP